MLCSIMIVLPNQPSITEHATNPARRRRRPSPRRNASASFWTGCAQHGRVLASELAAELHTSEHTVRRHLRDLASAGHCKRVYGGALLDLACGRSGIHAHARSGRPEGEPRGRRGVDRPAEADHPARRGFDERRDRPGAAGQRGPDRRDELARSVHAPAGSAGIRRHSHRRADQRARGGRDRARRRCCRSSRSGPTCVSSAHARSIRTKASPRSTPKRPNSSARWCRRAARSPSR